MMAVLFVALSRKRNLWRACWLYPMFKPL